MFFREFFLVRTIPDCPIAHRRHISIALISFVGLSIFAQGTRTSAHQASRPPMFVLQVGIGKYLDAPAWTDLRGAVTDVVEMRKVLESDRFQVPAANIVTLKDEQGTKQKIFASFRNHLLAGAKNYFEKTKKRDAVVLFQYSGHGSQAPDVDGDEIQDKLDETLVTYDSQDIKGKNFDITDDEIFALTAELKRYTDNIIYIFDSCHSGSGTRNAIDARRLPAGKTVPETVALPGLLTRSPDLRTVDNSDGGVLPPGEDYIVISAAEAEQLATQKYCFEECGSDKDPVVYGLLTYYLIDELKNSRNDTSYRELMDNVVRKVSAERPSQTPVIEGDKRRAVFGNLGKAEDNFVPIVGIETVSLRIHAGAIQGVAVGTVVYIYDKSATRFDQAEKVARGRVTAVSATESTVKFITKPTRPVTLTDKAVTASSDLASTRLKLFLGDVESKATSGVLVTAKLRSAFQPRDARGVDIIPNKVAAQSGRWDVALLKDKFLKVFPKAVQGSAHTPKCSGNPSAAGPSPDRDIYYIAGPDYVPLFQFCVEIPIDSESVDEAAYQIEKALTHISRYRSIQSVQNRRSRLAGKLVVKPIRLTRIDGRKITGVHNCINGKLTVDNYEAVAQSESGAFQVKRGDVFWFEVTNNSPFDLYVAMLNLKSDGSIALEFPRNIVGEKEGVLIVARGGKRIIVGDMCRLNDARQIIESGAFITPKAARMDRFKFIATTSPVGHDKLSYLEMEAIRNETASLATINEWITVDLLFEISD